MNTIENNGMIIPAHLETIAMLATHGERLKATSTHSGAVPVEVPWHFSSDHMMHPAETNYAKELVEIHERIAAIDGNKFVNEEL